MSDKAGIGSTLLTIDVSERRNANPIEERLLERTRSRRSETPLTTVTKSLTSMSDPSRQSISPSVVCPLTFCYFQRRKIKFRLEIIMQFLAVGAESYTTRWSIRSSAAAEKTARHLCIFL